MKRFFLLIAIFLLFFSCSPIAKQDYPINVYLVYHSEPSLYGDKNLLNSIYKQDIAYDYNELNNILIEYNKIKTINPYLVLIIGLYAQPKMPSTQ
jgi:hypothetical protein